MTPEVSVVLPCYNEAGNLKLILDRFRPLSRRAALELILVDNGSTDGSAAVLAEDLAKPENAFARSVKVERNRGYGHGIQTGLAAAKAPIVAFSHADLQCRPEDVLSGLELYRRHGAPCLAKGRRCHGRPAADRFVTSCFNLLARWLLGIVVRREAGESAAPDINAQPKLFPRALVEALRAAPSGFQFDLYVLSAAARARLPILEFDVTYEERHSGASKLAANPWVRLRTAVQTLLFIVRLRLRV